MTTTSRAGLGRSTAVMAAGTASSRVLGLLRTVVLVAAIGSATVAANTFAAANWLPNAIYMLIAGGVLNAVLVPQIVKADRSPRGHEFVDRLLSVSMALLLGATVVLVLAAPVVVTLAVGGPGEERDTRFLALTLAFAYVTLPQVFFYGLYTLLGQVLNARGMFGPYMWAPVVNNVVAIAGIGLFALLYDTGVDSDVGSYDFWTSGPVLVLGGTATLGVVAQALVLLVPLRRAGFRFRPRLGWRGVGLGGAARLAGWTFAALVVGQVGVWVVTRVASGAAQAQEDALVAGNAHYTNAFMIFMLPHSLVTVSLLTALYTRLAGHATAGDATAVRRDWSWGLRTLGVFTVFATAVLVVLALPVSRLVLIGDRPEAAAAMAPVVVALAVGLVPLGVWSLVQRVHYAYEDARTLFRLQVPMAIVVSLGAWGASAVLPVPWWTVGACAAISASYLLGALAGAQRVRMRLGGLGREVVVVHLKAGAGALAAAAVGWAVGRLFGDLSRAGLVTAALACVVVGLVMLAVYVGALRLMRVREMDALAGPVLLRLAPLVSRVSPGAGQALVRAASARTMAPGRAATADGGTGGPVVSSPAEAGQQPGGGRAVTSELALGTVLAGRYRLEEPAPSDLPGVECWTARDRVLDRPVRAYLLREGRITQAQDAARRAALVTDPRLVKVLDVGDHEGVPYVVTGPLPGRTLGELVARRPLSPEHARAVVGEAAVALEVARRRGVHHLALRPSSVRVTEDGQVLVTGLGMDGEVAGHGLGDARSTTRADTVGLVALLYLALTGRWPRRDGALPSDLPAAPEVDGHPVPPGDLASVPNDLDTLCTVTLGPHDDGPHSPAELVGDLEPWQDLDGPALYAAADQPGASAAGVPSSTAGAAASAASAAALVEPSPPDGVAADGDADASAPAAGDAGADDVAVAEVVTEATPTSVAAVSRTSVRETFDDAPPATRPGTPPPAIPPRRHLPRPDATPVGVPNPHGVTAAAAAPTPAGTPGAAPGRPAWPGAPLGGAGSPAPRTRPARPAGGPARPSPAVPAPDLDVLVDRSKKVLTGRAAFDPTPWVLTLFLAAVIIGVVVAWKALTAPAPPIGGTDGFGDVQSQATEEPTDEATTPPEGEETTEPPVETETPSAPPVIASAQQIDPPPQGDNNEHPEAVDRAIDEDPESYWFSRTYASPTYGMKPGIGYAVTLAEPAQVRSVTLHTNSVGGHVQIRATDPSTPTAGDPLAEGPMQNVTTFTFDPVEATHVVLWFTELPQVPDGRNRIELTTITVE